MNGLYNGFKPTAYKQEAITVLTPDELDIYGDNKYFDGLIPFQYEKVEYITKNSTKVDMGFTSREVKVILKTYGRQNNNNYLTFKRQDKIFIDNQEFIINEVKEEVDPKKVPFLTMNKGLKERFTLKTLYLI